MTQMTLTDCTIKVMNRYTHKVKEFPVSSMTISYDPPPIRTDPAKIQEKYEENRGDLPL